MKKYLKMLLILGMLSFPGMVVNAACGSGETEKTVYYMFADVNSSTTDGGLIKTAQAGSYDYYTSAYKYNVIPINSTITDKGVVDLYRTAQGTGNVHMSLTEYWNASRGNIDKTVTSQSEEVYTSGDNYYVYHSSWKSYADNNFTVGTEHSGKGFTNLSTAAVSDLVNASVLLTPYTTTKGNGGTVFGVPSIIADNTTMTIDVGPDDGNYTDTNYRFTIERHYLSSHFGYANEKPISLSTSSGTDTYYFAPAVYYAKFCAKATATGSWKLIYDSNGGTAVTENAAVTCDKTQIVSSTKPTKTGYTFKGWSTSSTSTTVTYQAGNTVNSTSTTSCKDVTLYAVWEATSTPATKSWTITYNVDGDTKVIQATTETCGKSQNVSETTPKKTNYIFKGWATAADKTKVVYTGGVTIPSNTTTCSDLTLYAVFEVAPKTGLIDYTLMFIGILLVSGAGYYYAKKNNLFQKIK